MMKLYGIPPTRALRVLWAIRELGLECELIPVNLLAGEGQKPEFQRLNPAGKLPVLVDGDFVLTESAAIVLYLAEKFPEKGLLPTDLRERAQAYRWIMFAMTELEQPLWRMAKHNNIYPPEKRIPADIELARGDFVTMAKVLDQHMSGRQFIVGNRFGAADCVTVYLMDWANLHQLLDDLPNLRAYMDRLYSRPAAPVRIADALAARQAGAKP